MARPTGRIVHCIWFGVAADALGVMPYGEDVVSLGLPVFGVDAAGSTSSVVPASVPPRVGSGGSDDKADSGILPLLFSRRGYTTSTCETSD